MANSDSGHGLDLMAGGIKMKTVLKFKSLWIMRELDLGTFLPRDRGSKKPAVLLPTVPTHCKMAGRSGCFKIGGNFLHGQNFTVALCV